ncbi:MAG: hypothetical protein VKS61_09560 [Candidatus Sericytochromatia bacterium]|nr:hypothetical protein [Candidatus Sericytochromatia bacterium]
MRAPPWRPWFSATLLLSLTGCWWLRGVPAPPDGSRLGAWQLSRLGVVTFADATYQDAGPRVGRLFAEALAASLGASRAVLLATGGADVGFIGVGQAQRLGTSHGVDGLVTGQVLVHGPEGEAPGASVVVGVRLLDANRGSIIWSRTVAGHAGAPEAATLDANLELAAARAAKELIDDLLAPPPDAAGDWRRPERPPGTRAGPRVARG